MTIKDVARRSGYAVGTVSRVLNGSPDVSEKARNQILAVVEEMNFRPNSHAKQLKQREDRGYGVIVKGTNNRLFAVLLEKIQFLMTNAGKTVTPYYISEHGDEVELAVRICREQKPLGILFLGGSRENFVRSYAGVSCPCVLVTCRADTLGFDTLSSVSTDDVGGAACAMGCLLESGHRTIGIIGGENCNVYPQAGLNTSQLRYLGCQQACLQHGVRLDTQCRTVIAPYSMDGGYEGACTLLDSCQGMTAILAMSDVMAIGAMRAVRDRGLRVPEDISVIGYDGLEQSFYCIPRLATIRQDADRMAGRSVDILLQQDGGGSAVHEIVPFQLVRGESVRPAPAVQPEA